MNNIEFLVNELRKANETIDNLRESNSNMRKRISSLLGEVYKLRSENAKLKYPNLSINPNPTLSDVDALALLKKKLSKS